MRYACVINLIIICSWRIFYVHKDCMIGERKLPTYNSCMQVFNILSWYFYKDKYRQVTPERSKFMNVLDVYTHLYESKWIRK